MSPDAHDDPMFDTLDATSVGRDESLAVAAAPLTLPAWLTKSGWLFAAASVGLGAYFTYLETIGTIQHGFQTLTGAEYPPLRSPAGTAALAVEVVGILWLLTVFAFASFRKSFGGLALTLVVGLYTAGWALQLVPYETWQRTLAATLSRGPYIGDLLGRAAARGDTETVDAFLTHGASVNARRGTSQRTPMHAAIVAGRSEAVKMLLAKGADLALVDSAGDAALDLAVAGKRDAIAEILTAKGAVRAFGSERAAAAARAAAAQALAERTRTIIVGRYAALDSAATATDSLLASRHSTVDSLAVTDSLVTAFVTEESVVRRILRSGRTRESSSRASRRDEWRQRAGGLERVMPTDSIAPSR
jgi:hypothetical protein